MTELCERYEITRQTGYVWLRRYHEAGAAGLIAHSCAAHRHRNQMPEEIEQRVLELRQAHMRWGPRKLKRILERDEPGRNWPAASTIGALLQREGLVVPRRKRVRTAPYTEPGAEWQTRTHASHAETGDRRPAGRQPAQAATRFGPLSPGIQLGASPRGAGHAHAGRGLCALGAIISGADARTGVFSEHAVAQRAARGAFSLR